MLFTPAELKDWVPVLFERSNAAVGLWNFESLVVTALFGFLSTARDDFKTTGKLTLIAICFIVFAVFNGLAIYTVTLEQAGLFDGLKPALKTSSFASLADLTITAPWQLNLGVHGLIDVVVIGTIVAVGWRNR